MAGNDKDFIDRLDAEHRGHEAEVRREKTTIMFSAELKEQLRAHYPKRSLGSLFEETTLAKLRADGFVAPKGSEVEPKGFEGEKLKKEVVKAQDPRWAGFKKPKD